MKKLNRRMLALVCAFVLAFTSIVFVYADGETETEKVSVTSSDKLEAYYSFDDTLVNEVTGESAKLHGGAGDTWNAEATGTASYATGVSGNAYSFAGNSDGVSGEGLQLDVTTGEAFTISLWVNTSQKVNYQPIVFTNYDSINYVTAGTNYNDFASGGIVNYNNFWYWLDKNNNCSSTLTDIVIGEWTYITITMTSDGVATLYYNAEVLSTQTVADYDSTIFTGMPIFLGINWWDASFCGFMDEVTVYSEALSAVDVAALYANDGVPYTVEEVTTTGAEAETTTEEAETTTEEAETTTEATAETTTEAAAETTTEAAAETTTGASETTTVAEEETTTATGDSEVETETVTVETVDATIAAYYTFDDTLENSITGGSAALHGGAGDTWNAETTGTENYATGVSGSAYNFLGNSDGVSGEGLVLDVLTTTEYTISYWINASAVTSATSQVFIAQSNDDDTMNGLNIADNWFGATYPTVRIWSDNGSFDATYLDYWTPSGDAAEFVGVWKYITLTCDGENVSLYVDGVLAGSGTTASDFAGEAIYLGINWWDSSFCGLMDELVIYTEALTADEVAALYANDGNPYTTKEVVVVTAVATTALGEEVKIYDSAEAAELDGAEKYIIKTVVTDTVSAEEIETLIGTPTDAASTDAEIEYKVATTINLVAVGLTEEDFPISVSVTGLDGVTADNLVAVLHQPEGGAWQTETFEIVENEDGTYTVTVTNIESLSPFAFIITVSTEGNAENESETDSGTEAGTDAGDGSASLSPQEGDVSVWIYVILLVGAAAACVLIAKKRVTE